MKATWGTTTAVIADVQAFDAIVARIQASLEPTIIWLEADDGSVLTVGVGRDESVLAYVDPDGKTFHSVGDTERRGHTQFLNGTQTDDYMLEMAVPVKLALAAAKQFIANQRRSEIVRWEEDWPDGGDPP